MPVTLVGFTQVLLGAVIVQTASSASRYTFSKGPMSSSPRVLGFASCLAPGIAFVELSNEVGPSESFPLLLLLLVQ